MIINKKIQAVIFFILLIIFSICYWSFFPGAYSFDSYFTYQNSLGIIPYREVVSPVFSLYWKVLNNYNFAPLLINYLIFVLALILSVKFTRSYYIAILSIIGICLPYTLITYIFAWKDNALLTMMFLASVLCLKKDKSSLYTSVILLVLLLAFLLRVNAVFAIIPFLFYLFLKKYGSIKTISLTAGFILASLLVNTALNKFIFKAEKVNFIQTIMYTDIAKINYWEQQNVVDDIPKEFINSENLNEENVNKLFYMYCNNSCNDILYMYPEWQGAKIFLHNNTEDVPVDNLKKIWFSKVINNPITYLQVRAGQMHNSIWNENLLYSSEALIFNEKTFEAVAGGPEGLKKFDRESKVFYPPANTASVGIRNFIGSRSEFLNSISYPGLYWVFLMFLCFAFFVNRKKNEFYRFGIYLSGSGILYTLGYLPMLPCTDYRYFIWTIFCFWISLGLIVLAIFTTKEQVVTE